jgi:hypothetical protein
MGKPNRLDLSSCTESIGAEKPTRGSETSQYPEERKSKETPLVAASERGPGQTKEIRLLGVVGPQHGTNDDSGNFWKVVRYRVIGPYAKSELALEVS